MVQHRNSGPNKRSGYMDRETLVESRSIMRENSRQGGGRPGRTTGVAHHHRARLLEVASKSRREEVRSAAEVLAERLADGETPDQATAAALNALLYVHGGAITTSLKRDWERAEGAVLALWARTIGKNTPEGEKVLANLPQRPSIDAPMREKLLTAGRTDPNWDEVARGGEKLAELLASGWKFGPASAKAWKNLADRAPDETERRRLGRLWAGASRAMQLEWAKTHPGDAPKAPARPSRNVLDTLVRAGESVRSWPLFQPEGQMLVDEVASGASFEDALEKATTELETRRERVSEEEWKMVKREWAMITEAVGRSHRRSAPRAGA